MVQREQVPLHACQDMIQLLGRGYCGGLRQECGLVAGTMAGYLLLEVELCSEPQGREPHGAKPMRPRQAGQILLCRAKGRLRKRRHPSGQEGHGKAGTWPAADGGGSGQAKVLQAGHAESDPASTVEEGRREGVEWGSRSGLDCARLDCAFDPAQGMWDWWWQEARGV